MTYDYTKSHKKTWFHPFSGKYIFEKTTGERFKLTRSPGHSRVKTSIKKHRYKFEIDHLTYSK